jgi:DnaD/phage-associated family protein
LITQLENQYGNDLLIAAMKVTAKNNKDNIGYVEGVLTKWEETGAKDIDQASEFERQFKKRIKK